MSATLRGPRPSGDRERRDQRPARPERSARAVAAEVLVRIEAEGAYANLLLPEVLDRSGLPPRDRRFVTELVYGVTRRRRSLDWLVDRHLTTGPPLEARTLLRLGAYQLLVLDTPAHAAVGETVAAAQMRWRALCNAVLRKVAGELEGGSPDWPDLATELSYPDWIVERLTADLGAADAEAALRTMDAPAQVTERADGYTQDLGSQWVAAGVGAAPGERVLDVCAAPGGKATAMAHDGALVTAVELHPHRTRLIEENVCRLGLAERVEVVTADATALPFGDGAFDRVLVDAPCSGLGSLRRRPDARWRIRPADVDELVDLQRRLLAEAARVVRPGGIVAYAVCTLAAAETAGIDEWAARALPQYAAVDPLDPDRRDASGASNWEPRGRGALLLPQAAGTDGMYLLRLQRGDDR